MRNVFAEITKSLHPHNLKAAQTACTVPAQVQASQKINLDLGRAFDILTQSEELLPVMVAEGGRICFLQRLNPGDLLTFQFDSPTPCTQTNPTGLSGLQR